MKPAMFTTALGAAVLAALSPIAAFAPAFAQPSALPGIPAAPAPLYTRSEMLEKLQEGGLILLIRHERTEVPSRPDDYTQPANECRAQRNLSLAGMAGAKETGVVLRALGIKAGRVLSSPMCRSAETARFMFGVDYETDPRLMHHDPGENSQRDLNAAARELQDVLREIAPGQGGSNIAIVTHGGNIVMVSGLHLSEGEIGVLKLGEDGSVTTYGQMMGSDLAPEARRELEKEAAQ